MYRLLERAKHTAAKCLRHIVAVSDFGVLPHGFEIVGSNFIASVGSGGLICEVAFKFGIPEEDAVDEEREVGAEREHFLSFMMERITHFLNSGEDILFEIFVTAKFGAANVNELERFALESDCAVLIEEDCHISACLNFLTNGIYNGTAKFLLVAVVVAFAKKVLPLLARVFFQELQQVGGDE